MWLYYDVEFKISKSPPRESWTSSEEQKKKLTCTTASKTISPGWLLMISTNRTCCKLEKTTYIVSRLIVTNELVEPSENFVVPFETEISKRLVQSWHRWNPTLLTCFRGWAPNDSHQGRWPVCLELPTYGETEIGSIELSSHEMAKRTVSKHGMRQYSPFLVNDNPCSHGWGVAVSTICLRSSPGYT